MIIKEERIAFIHIPKCGGTSIEEMLHESFEGKGRLWSERNERNYHIGQNRQHATLAELHEKFDLTGWKVFTVVRDPLQRARSEFLYQIAEDRRCREIKAYRNRDLGEAIKSGLLFELGYVRHEKPASFFLKKPESLNLFGGELEILNLESIQEDLKLLGKKWNVSFSKIPHSFKSSEKLDWNWKKSEFYELEGRWKGDFELGGYRPPHPVIDKKIWMLWEQGWENAPRVAKCALRSWRTLNPEYEVVELDSNSPEYLEAEKLWEGKKMKHAAHRADLLRLWLLATKGGAWVDATVLCLSPLRSWLYEECGERGFFVFNNHPVATWFIFASTPHNKWVTRWFEASVNYWEKRGETNDYYWLHHLFQKAVKDHGCEISASSWAKLGPHLFANYAQDLNGKAGPFFFPRLLSESPKMLKLTRHITPKCGSKFDWLLKSFE